MDLMFLNGKNQALFTGLLSFSLCWILGEMDRKTTKNKMRKRKGRGGEEREGEKKS